MLRSLRSIVVTSAVIFMGCGTDSSATNDGQGDASTTDASSPTGIPEAFHWFCAGTLLVDKSLMLPNGPGGWETDSSKKALAGTSILVATAYHKWDAYVFLPDGTPAKVDTDFTNGLVINTDFSSSCATEDKQADGIYVVLAKSTFYPNAQLTGTACSLDAGTMLDGFSFQDGTSSAQVSSTEIKSQCGLDAAYTADMVYGQLITR